ncbi:hypothetical protein FZC37_01950 [Candidatus Sneabacter namystus]|uniref:Tetratricopeptide repeat protein n=1 Tax=Candidatus Sneabacter namystus TaxID=2601646 RepID=A0A5C0UHX3_9RICK|nr:hypothetical protein FZC37_01950 [Candidatus Sneabacter namystus]
MSYGFISEKNAFYALLMQSHKGLSGPNIEAPKGISDTDNSFLKEYYNLVQVSLHDEHLNEAIDNLKELTKSDSLGMFAKKKLADVLFKMGKYSDSLEFSKSFAQDDNPDPNMLMLVVKSYYMLQSWNNFDKYADIVLHLSDVTLQQKEEISNMYAESCKADIPNSVKIDHAMKAVKYNKMNQAAYKELTSVFLSENRKEDALNVLEKQFSHMPTFDTFLEIESLSPLEGENLYDELSLLVAPTCHKECFVAIGVYLNLNEKIQSLVQKKETVQDHCVVENKKQ